MRRCYRGAAFVLGGILLTGYAPFNSCSVGTLTVQAAEDALTEELETAFQEEVQTGAEDVETEIPGGGEDSSPEEAEESQIGLEEQEYQVLLKIVEAEAGGEDSTGKLLVANVIMNRVRSEDFPDTVTDVVYQRSEGKAQFSPVADGRIDSVSVSQDTVEAVARAMDGEDASAGALYFRSVNSRSGWFDRSLERVMEYGNHIFYTNW